MFESLFGDLPLAAKFVLAFAIVLALIALAAFAYRRFAGARLGTATGRGRQPRLAVIDAASVDGRRRLVLIRRDNVEHLVLIGGPTDVVIEQNIVRAVPVAPQREAPPARGHDAPARHEGAPRMPEAAPRSEAPARPEPRAPQQDAGWGPAPEPVPRSSRPAESTWSPEAVARAPRQSEPRGPALPPIDVPPRPLPEPVTAALRAPTPDAQRKPAGQRSPEPEAPVEMRQSPPTADVNLADMAQRLEAALRRPARPAESAPRESAPRESAPRPEPKPRPMEAARPAAPIEPPRPARPAPNRDMAPELPGTTTPSAAMPNVAMTLPTVAAPSAAAPDVAPEPTPEPAKPSEATAEPQPQPAKSVFDSLEEEMANLLGRPTGKT